MGSSHESAAKPLIIWTRSDQYWHQDRKLFDGKGVSVEHWPCVNHNEYEVPQIDQQVPSWSPDIVIFTSQRAVKSAADHPILKEAAAQSWRVVTFAPKTLEAVRAMGWSAHQLEAESAAQIADECVAKAWHSHRIWIIGPKEPAHDVTKDLVDYGFCASYIAVYETHRAPQTTFKADVANRSPRLFVCFASPSAVKAFISNTDTNSGKGLTLTAIAIGRTTARACDTHFAEVIVASQTTIESLANAAIKAVQGTTLDRKT